MNTYRFTATNQKGQIHSGTLRAVDIAAAREQLVIRGFHSIELREAKSEKESKPLSRAETEEVMHHVAQLSTTDLPLAPGLRAAAAEIESQRVSVALQRIANQLERGMSLQEIVGSPDSPFPRWAVGLVAAAVRSGRLGLALVEFVRHQRATERTRRIMLRAFAYPAFVVSMAAIVLLSLTYLITSPYKQMFAEFEIQLPFATQFLFWWRDAGIPVLLALVLMMCLSVFIARCMMSRASWFRLLSSLPIIGPLWKWSGIAEWSGLLRVLLRYEIPLPEALRLAGEGTRNAELGQLSFQFANATSQGKSLARVLSDTRSLPDSLIPLIEWGEKNGKLDEALGTGRELFDRRTQIRSSVIRAVLPGVLFILIGCAILFVVSGIFMPLLTLLQGLS